MVRTKIIDLTPEIAKEFLSHNEGNRRMSSATVAVYADDMRNGRWHENGQPLTVTNGILRSGQHRCAAVVKSGVTLRNTVVIYTDDAEMIDTGKTRTVMDLCGMKTKISAAITMVIQMSEGVSGTQRMSKSLIIEKYEDWKKSCDFIDRVFTNCNAGLCRDGVTGAVLAAHLVGYSEDNLEQFVLAFQTGFMNNDIDMTAIALRNASINSREGGAAARQELYLKAQSALQSYAKGKRLTKIYALSQPCYVPEV